VVILRISSTDSESTALRVDFEVVWFQKISIPPPQRVIGSSEGEGGLKGQNV